MACPPSPDAAVPCGRERPPGELGDALLLGQLLLQTEVKASRSVLVAGPWLWAIAILEGSDFVGELQGNKRI